MQGNVGEHELHAIGTSVFKNFELLNHKTVKGAPFADQLSRNRLVGEEQRFRLWAHSLGLHRTGHASLDYRLRDAVVIRNYTAEVLGDLKNNLDDLLAIVLGVRKPFELEDTAEEDHEASENVEDQRETFEEAPSVLSGESEESPKSETSGASSESSFHEIDFRLKSIVERIDALFRLAIKIRSPANRPMRTTADLYKRIPAASRDAYIREREQAAISIVTYVQRQQLAEVLRREVSNIATWEANELHGGATWYRNTITGATRHDKPPELMSARERAIAAQDWRESISSSSEPGKKYYTNKKTKEQTWEMPKEYEAALNAVSVDWETAIDTYGNPEHWIIRRTGMANARRRQQFVYWKEHAGLIGKEVPEKPAAIPEKDVIEPISAVVPVKPSADATLQNPEATAANAKSLATSATKLQPSALKLDDLKSVFSHQSRVSTVLSPQGEKIDWPPPPVELTEEKFFTCPYCSTICPQIYLSKEPWRVHVIHDLQPYHCTYHDCADPHRLYGSHDEWLAHENLHRRVWRCASDQSEFETQPLYVEHLKHAHADDKDELLSPELVAAAVNASTQIHRDCPFCPTAFTDVTHMRKHLTWHLEKLALFALPDINDHGAEDEDRSERSFNSKQGIHPRKGRQKSIMTDFTTGKVIGLSEDYGRGERNPDDRVPTDPMFHKIRDEPSYQLEDSMLEEDFLAWLKNIPEKELQTAENAFYVRALFNRQPKEADELQFNKGDIITVIKSMYEGWWNGTLRGQTGVFPVNYTEPYEPREDAAEKERKVPSWYRRMQAPDIGDSEDQDPDRVKSGRRLSRDSLTEPLAPSTQTTFPDLPFPRDERLVLFPRHSRRLTDLTDPNMNPEAPRLTYDPTISDLRLPTSGSAGE